MMTSQQEQNAKGRDVIFSQGSGNRGNLAIRKGDWKLIIKSDRNDASIRVPIELYNLAENVYENEDGNVIDDAEKRGKVEELLHLYNQMRDSEKRTTDRFLKHDK